jgi:DNA-binding CsgD family transcriptional regulator/catechol 2,3-dioxygenase-like lactoylglutathione lyase family enzyme
MPTTRGRGRPAHPDVLTPTEWRVLDALRHGMARREIAERRGISLNAVKYHARNIAGKLGVDSARELRLWPGQPAGSAIHTRETAAMTTDLRLGPIAQVSLQMRDVARTEAFYRDTLGLPHVFTFGDLAFFDASGLRIYLHRVAEADWRPSSVLYFLVDDILAAHDQLIKRGVKVTGAPHLIFRHDDTGIEEWLAFFEDSEGNLLAITSRVAGSTSGER